MRHDWTMLCTEVQDQRLGTIGLGYVFTRLKVSDSDRIANEGALLAFEKPVLLVSHWTVEFDIDDEVHPLTIQLFSPTIEEALWTEKLEVDCRDRKSIRIMYSMDNLQFAGIGTYEFHVLVGDLFEQTGEFGRACLVIN